MSEDFFGDLGKSISRYTKKAVDKTSTMVEGAKISAQISAEHREIDKLYQKIGETVYRKAMEKTIDLDDDLSAFVDEIRQRKEKTNSLKKDLADVRGQKVCPNCGELIPKEVAFCPKCGAPAPTAADETKDGEGTESSEAAKKQPEEKTEEQKAADMEAIDAEFTEIREEETVDEVKSAETADAEDQAEKESAEAETETAETEFESEDDASAEDASEKDDEESEEETSGSEDEKPEAAATEDAKS